MYVDLQNINSFPMNVTCEAPQGLVLGPLLFAARCSIHKRGYAVVQCIVDIESQ